ncbi:MAG: TRAP transporter substrate-binding protein DctP [Pseudomonadales bacterium]|nr:TRAP transporter substrate-binding protein DctP [Pseudomonadales bacterium]
MWRFLLCALSVLASMVASADIDIFPMDVNHAVTSKATAQWKFSHPAPPNSQLPPILQSGFDWLQAETSGELLIKMYGGGTLYGVRGGFKAVRAGIADYGTCYTIIEPKGFELTHTTRAPYLLPENPYLSAFILRRLSARYLKDEFERRGVHMGYSALMRPLSILSKDPIRSPEDLRGKKIGSYLGAFNADKALSFTEVRVPFPDLYTALQQGVIDGVLWIDFGMVPYKLYEQAKHFTDISVSHISFETCINKKSFARLPTNLKQSLVELQNRLPLAITHEMYEYSKIAKKQLQAHGVTIHELSTDAKKQWRAAFKPVTDQWLATCDQTEKDCRGVAAEIKKLSSDYSHLSDEELVKLMLNTPSKGVIDF